MVLHLLHFEEDRAQEIEKLMALVPKENKIEGSKMEVYDENSVLSMVSILLLLIIRISSTSKTLLLY